MSRLASSPAPEAFASFGDLLKYLRRRAHLTQRDLSIAVGYSEPQISYLETNRRLPDMATVAARFVPTLDLQDEPALARRLVELAEAARREAGSAPGDPPFKGLHYFTSPPTLPNGTVTFLFTDVVGSVALWEREPSAAYAALIQHDTIIESLVVYYHGVVVRPRGEGDTRFVVFAHASDAVDAAAAIQQALWAQTWPTTTPLRIRMALHTGESIVRQGDYYGSAVNRCARLRSIAHGGQTVLSAATAELVQDSLPGGIALQDLGLHRLRDLIQPEHVYQLVIPNVPSTLPSL